MVMTFSYIFPVLNSNKETNAADLHVLVAQAYYTYVYFSNMDEYMCACISSTIFTGFLIIIYALTFAWLGRFANFIFVI